MYDFRIEMPLSFQVRAKFVGIRMREYNQSSFLSTFNLMQLFEL